MSGLEIGLAITVSQLITCIATKFKILYTPENDEFPYSIGCYKTTMIQTIEPLKETIPEEQSDKELTKEPIA